MAAFKNLGLHLNKDHAKLLIQRFDDDRDGLLSFTNITNIFRPRDKHLSNLFKNRVCNDHKKIARGLDQYTLGYVRSLILRTL